MSISRKTLLTVAAVLVAVVSAVSFVLVRDSGLFSDRVSGDRVASALINLEK